MLMNSLNISKVKRDHNMKDPSNEIEDYVCKNSMKLATADSLDMKDLSKHSHESKNISLLKHITNIDQLVSEENEHHINSDKSRIQKNKIVNYQKNMPTDKIVDDIPGLAREDCSEWLEPRQTILNVNVLEIFPQSQSKITSTSNSIAESSNISFQAGKIKTIQYSNSSKSQIYKTTTGMMSCKKSLSNVFNNNELSFSGSLNKNDEIISNFFNLNVNISSDKNGKVVSTNETYRTPVLHNEESNIRLNDISQERNITEDSKQCEVKDEGNSFCSFVKEDLSENSLFNGTKSKPIMNLTNFYNDAKNQIDDSECDSSSFELGENSQYESVTVLKSEPITDNSALNKLNGNVVENKHLSNLDDAIFIFQNNLEPLEKSNAVFNTKKFCVLKSDDPTPLNCKSTTSLTDGNNIKNIASCDDKLSSKQKIRNISCTNLLLSSQSIADIRNTPAIPKELGINEDLKNNHDDSSNMLCGINGFITSHQNKIPNNKINVKYFSIPNENNITLNSSSLSKTNLKNNYLVKTKLPGHNTKANVKYLVKDKNVFKLVYVKAPQTEMSTNNIQIFNQTQRKQQSKEKKIDQNPLPFSKKTNTIFEPSAVNLPKLVQFESIQNKSCSLTDISKSKKINNCENSDQKQDVSSKPVNIIYQPTKHPIIVGPKNLIVNLPSTKPSKTCPSTETLKQVISFSTDKDLGQKSNKQYNVVSSKKSPTVSTNESADQTPAICSTAMEQVREFESILEKVTKTSQLKEKASPVEDIDDNSYSTSQPVTKNVTSVSLGNILIQPSKVAAYTNLVYAPTCKKSVTEKSLSLKQPIVSSKTENKVVKSTISNFPNTSTIISNNPSSNSTKPTQKTQEDEKTTEKIYKILHSYSEKIKNAPELKNKPAPRRRSNPPMNPSSKCKKNLKCAGKLTFEPSNGLDLNREFESTQKEVITTVFPQVPNQSKDVNSSSPLQIHHLTVPSTIAQENQVVFVTNDKHLILKKIKNVQKIWTKSPSIVKPILQVDPNVQNTQVIQYNIKNNTSGNSLSFINYIPTSNNKPANIHSHLTSFSPLSAGHTVGYQSQVCKLAQETQTDVTMQYSAVLRTTENNIKSESKRSKSCVNKCFEVDPKNVLEQNECKFDRERFYFCISVDSHYFKNTDVLFFTSLIFLNHPSSQFFMFEAINALNRIMQTNQSLISNSTSKNFSIEQIHKLGSSFWQKFRIVYDIKLKKKGPHITDTMIMAVEKADTKAINDKLLKLNNNFFEDKIKVNKCNKNPKCYGKKNGESSNFNKNVKFPHPLEPTVIITNKLDAIEDKYLDRNDSLKKMSKCGRKRSFSKFRTINFDEIEIYNPKINIPTKKKKTNKGVSFNSPSEILKNKDLNNGYSVHNSEKRRQQNRLKVANKKNISPKLLLTEKPNNRKVFNKLGSNIINESLFFNGQSKLEKKKLDTDLKLQKTYFGLASNSVKNVRPTEASTSKTSFEMLNQNISTPGANKRIMRSVTSIHALKKQKIN